MKKLNIEKMDYDVEKFDTWESKGKLNLSPEYQRDFVYSVSQSSKLIESSLMGIPLPTIYLCEEENGNYSIIDGQQRITSFLKFKRNEFALKDLTNKELKSLNGKFYKDLSEEEQSAIDGTAFRTIIILKDSADTKYDIFERLNRGAVSLKEQELRNCVYRGPYNSMINDLAENKLLRKMLYKENKRMAYQEYILRIFALRNYTSFNQGMKSFFNKYMKLHQNDDEASIQKDKKYFNNTLSIVNQVLGDDAFATIDFDKKIQLNKFSATLFDSIMIPFGMFDKTKLIAKKDEIKKAISELKLNDEKYHMATYVATGNKENVITRINLIYMLLLHILGEKGLTETARNFPPKWKEPKAKLQNYICPLCMNKMDDLDECVMDHILPFDKGGLTIYENCQVTHKQCNLHKSNHVQPELTLEDIYGRPSEGQRVVKLSEDTTLAWTKPDYLFYKGKAKKVKEYFGLLEEFVKLLAGIDAEKFVELANEEFKLTKQSRPYIKHDKDGMYNPIEVVAGTFVEAGSIGADRTFLYMKELAKRFKLNLDDLSFSLVMDEEENN